MATRPHNNLFHDVFEHPEHARGELQHLLGVELSARLDWSTLEPVPGSFVDEELRDSYSDLLFRVMLAGRPAYVYLLFEHQSSPEPLFVLRALQYTVRFLTTWVQDHLPKGKAQASGRKTHDVRQPPSRTDGESSPTKLPVVIPILLYHGASPWPYALRFEDVLDVDPETRALVLDFVPKFRLVLDDLTAQTDEDLRSRAMSELGRVVLWLFKTARSTEDLVSSLSGWAELLGKVKAAPNGMAALAKIWHYMMAVHEGSHERVLPALAAAIEDEEQRQQMATIAEQLIDKGIEKGIEKERRAVLARLLDKRFGPLPEEARTRIEEARPSDLERWIDHVLTASSLTEVWQSGS